MAAEHVIREPILVRDDGPVCFFMSPPVDSSKYEYKREYERLRLQVLEHGGKWLATSEPAEAVILARPSEAVAIAAAVSQDQRKVHLSKFVDDCIKHKTLLLLTPYEVRVPRPYHFYTEEEDSAIEAFVREAHACNEYGRRPRSIERDHPQSIHGNLLWQAAEAEGVAKPHTWHSLKDRFLKFIRPRMRARDRKRLGWLKERGECVGHNDSMSSSEEEEEEERGERGESSLERKEEERRGEGGLAERAGRRGRERTGRYGERASEGERRGNGENREREECAGGSPPAMIPERRQKEIQEWIKLIAEKTHRTQRDVLLALMAESGDFNRAAKRLKAQEPDPSV